MPSVVLSGVLPLTKWHVGWWLHNVRATPRRMLEVPIDIRNGDVHVLADLIRLRSAKRPAVSTEHDGALRNSKLRVTEHSVAFNAEALREVERSAQPLDGLTDVFIDQDRDNRRSGCGLVRNHNVARRLIRLASQLVIVCF
jgi:hypothetical protein